mmetsp:Transcript_24762/g.40765  ORF Transcript_24762/g.40765 Transcript_24762/m.40765 type:complete len:160 (+) Transcript_24762:66-545(+)
MGYVDAWDDFYAQAESLFLADPQNTRYVIKYRHVDSKLVLKVTDNKVCLKYRTDQASDLKKVEKLNNLFFRLMTTKKDALGEATGMDISSTSSFHRSQSSKDMPAGKKPKTEPVVPPPLSVGQKTSPPSSSKTVASSSAPQPPQPSQPPQKESRKGKKR